MPSELHEQLAQAAEREEVSLNRFVTDASSTSVDPAERARLPPTSRGDEPCRTAGFRRRRATLRLALATNLVVVVIAAVAAVVLLVLALQRGI